MRRTKKIKLSQTFDLKESRCIINVASSASSTGYSRFQPWKIFGAYNNKMGVWSIVFYRDILKVIPKAKFVSHSHGNMKQSAIIGVTEPTLETMDAASVASHELKNGTAPILTW